jgi:pyridoxamine 5'-phosphate oxidase family protein
VSVFTPGEIEYLRSQRRAVVATVGRDGQPHIVPLTFTFNAEEDAIDVGGVDFGGSKKWRDAQQNPKVTVLVEDVIVGPPRQARAIEVRGTAELHETGGDSINPRFPNFAPEFFRVRPTRIVSWGLEEEEGSGVSAGEARRGFRRNARNVAQSG